MNAQRGAVLAIALIFLVLLTLLGFSVMSVSQQELQMAGQFQAQALAQEQAEECLKTAQAEAVTVVDTQLNVVPGTFSSSPGRINIAGGDAQAVVGDPSWWNDPAHTLSCAAGGQYVIEYLGTRDMVLPEDRYTGLTHAQHAFRITTHGTGGGSANVVLQTIYLRNTV